MKKKLIFINILFLFFMTGCTVEYNINISNDTVNEEIKIIEEKSKTLTSAESMYNDKIYSQFNSNGKILYKKNKIVSDKENVYILKQKYELKNFRRARALTECFDAVNLVKNKNGNYIFQTSIGFKCMLYNYYKIDSYVVNIKTDYDVINTNADIINDNVYTWKINNTNAEKKSITFEFNKEKKTNNKEENKKDEDKSKKETNIFVILGIIIVLAIIGIFILLYALNLNKKRNKL